MTVRSSLRLEGVSSRVALYLPAYIINYYPYRYLAKRVRNFV